MVTNGFQCIKIDKIANQVQREETNNKINDRNYLDLINESIFIFIRVQTKVDVEVNSWNGSIGLFQHENELLFEQDLCIRVYTIDYNPV